MHFSSTTVSAIIRNDIDCSIDKEDTTKWEENLSYKCEKCSKACNNYLVTGGNYTSKGKCYKFCQRKC